jgi:hypothetical protein
MEEAVRRAVWYLGEDIEKAVARLSSDALEIVLVPHPSRDNSVCSSGLTTVKSRPDTA